MKCAGGSPSSMTLGKQYGISCVNSTATARRTCCLLNLGLLVSGLGSSVRHRVLRSCPTLNVHPIHNTSTSAWDVIYYNSSPPLDYTQNFLKKPAIMIMWSSPEMDVNRGEGLDGEHASPGRILAPSPSSQRFLGLPPTILNIFWNAFEIFNKRWNVLQSLNISFKHLLSTTFLLADMNEKCESASKHKENLQQLSCLA